MKFISILTILSFILILSCEKKPTSPPPNTGDDGGNNEEETNYTICTNCIWLQEDCNGNWILGYNIDVDFSGFQFDVSGATINSVSGGDAENAGFQVSHGEHTVLGFSLSGGIIPAGSGTLCNLNLNQTPTGLPNDAIIFPDVNGESLNISSYGIINCYYSTLENTGISQLTIFNDSIVNLEIGDEIGIFDLEGITNYNNCLNQKGELLVGSGIWKEEQLNLVSIGSVDLCEIDGVQLSGYIEGHPLIIRIYRPALGLEYSTEILWETGLGYFGETIQSISNITLIEPGLSKVQF